MTTPTPKPVAGGTPDSRPGAAHPGSIRELNLHLPPHLREVCALLALGLVRLRSRSAAANALEAVNVGAGGESSLHFVSEQSGGGARATRRAA